MDSNLYDTNDKSSSKASIWSTPEGSLKKTSSKKKKKKPAVKKTLEKGELPPGVGPVTSAELSKREARAKKFSQETEIVHNWDNVVLRSRFQNNPTESNEKFLLLDTRPDQISYFQFIQQKIIKLKKIDSGKTDGDWHDIVQCFRKLREAVICDENNVDNFVLKVYQESIRTIISIKKESIKDQFLEQELVKSITTLGEKLYPAYLKKIDLVLTDSQWNELGNYYSLYLFYLIGYCNFHFGHPLKKCLDPFHKRFLTHTDCQLARKLCFSLIHFQYVPFFALLSLCDSFQRKLLEPVSESLRSKALYIMIHSYLQLPTSQMICNLGFNDFFELKEYLDSIPQTISSSKRCPHFSTDLSTVLFRKR